MEKHRTPTGHRDCCGDMICEGDTVVTRHGESRVISVDKSWRLQYEDSHLEPLNCYDACRLRRMCDNGVTTENIVTAEGVTKNGIVTGLSQELSHAEGAQGQEVKPLV